MDLVEIRDRVNILKGRLAEAAQLYSIMEKEWKDSQAKPKEPEEKKDLEE